MVSPTVGILALQGGVGEHAALLARSGADVRLVKTPDGLDGLDALVLPGGESTTMTLGIDREGLRDPLRRFAATGRPVLATCAGLILLDREHLDVLPIRCERNAFGRQTHSFESAVDVVGIDGGPVNGVFIRAPKVVDLDPGVEITARDDDAVVGVRSGAVEGYAFHPELTDDDRIHRAFVERVRAG
ncbi:MAG: pyridoxal 5'-phosphate synthase glutaminase subunit PdxT, partial [Patulibacter sp.]|nr:pyridoxal 5'-phosphate synthase glutaminase subunit PdxT [Patulibacter sp.]